MLDLLSRQLKEVILQPFVPIFKRIHPNIITLLSGAVGIAACVSIVHSDYTTAIILWILNRLLDGLDGTVARISKRQSQFGGYLDIIVDFTVYSLITVAIAYTESYNLSIFATKDSVVELWLATSLLNGVFFVNAASLFMFTAIQAQNAAKNTELTTVAMSPSTVVIEGTETVVAYTVFLLFPQYIVYSYTIFGACVGVNILQRLYDAYNMFDGNTKKSGSKVRRAPSTSSTPSTKADTAKSPSRRKSTSADNYDTSSKATPQRNRSKSRSRKGD